MRILLADSYWGMCNVELNWPSATSLEVYKQQPVLSSYQIARMRLTVQQLLRGASVAD